MSDTPKPAELIRAVMLSHGHADWTDLDADNMTENVLGVLKDAGYRFFRNITPEEEAEDSAFWAAAVEAGER